MGTIHVGIDTGGTFTDLVSGADALPLPLSQSADTDPDPAAGILRGIAELLDDNRCRVKT